MAEATAHHGGPSTGHPPTSLGLNSRKLGLWAFIGSECMFFAALITAYLVMKPRNIAQGGPVAHSYFNLYLVSALAGILLASSVTMVLALAANERDDRKWERIWLAATIALGLTFLGGQVFEFNKTFNERFVTYQITKPDGETERRGVIEHEEQAELAVWQREFPGATIARYPNETDAVHRTTWTTSLFGSTFFTLTGFHGTHVAIGAIWLLVVLVMSLTGHITSKNSLTVEMAGLYWHFVDLVWVAIFTLIYLI